MIYFSPIRDAAGCIIGWARRIATAAYIAKLPHIAVVVGGCIGIGFQPFRPPVPPVQPAPPVETVPLPMTATPPSYIWMPYTPPAPELLPPAPAPLPPAAYLPPTPRAVPEPGAVWVLAVGTLMIVKMRIKRITSP